MLNCSAVLKSLNKELQSPWLMFFFSLLTIASSLFGCELIYYSFCWVIVVYMLLFAELLYPVSFIIITLYLSPSVINNPGLNIESIYYPGKGLEYIFFLLLSIVILFLVRFIYDYLRKKRKYGYPRLMLGFLLLSISFLFAGQHFSTINKQNTLYAILQIAGYCLPYILLFYIVDFSDVPKDYFAWMMMFTGLIVTTEVLYIYASTIIIYNGLVFRGSVYTGWGMYNNLAVIIDMAIPGALYLVSKKKTGWLFLIVTVTLFGGVFLTNSRTGQAVGTIILLLSCLVILIYNLRKEKWILALLVVIMVVVGFYYANKHPERLNSLLSDLDSFEDNDGGGRISTWIAGLELYKQYPVFGTGWYSCKFYQFSNHSFFIPPRWHNTYVQLLASTGLFGLGAYLFHRLETLIVFIKKFSFEAIMIMLSIAALLGCSLMDCHMFNVGPVIEYSILLVFLEKVDFKKKDKE